MRLRQLAAIAVLALAAGCGPSAEERYQAAVELYETEQKELDRIDQAIEAWIAAADDSEIVTWKLALARAKRNGETEEQTADLRKLIASAEAAENAQGSAYKAARDAQAIRVEKARAARDAADKARH